MRRHMSNRSELLLMEIIIAILFFSILSAVCLQIFTKSHQLSKHSENLNLAVTQTDSVAAVLYHSDQPVRTLSSVYTEGAFTEASGILTDGEIYYDDGRDLCDAQSAAYILSIQLLQTESSIPTYRISFRAADDQAPIYSIDTLIYTPAGKDVTP